MLLPRPRPIQKTRAHVATRAQWPKHTSSMQAHAQTELGLFRRSVLDARYAGVIPPSGSESRELMVPSKRCWRSPPPELDLIRWLRREARNPFGQGTTSRSARQEVILYLWCLLRRCLLQCQRRPSGRWTGGRAFESPLQLRAHTPSQRHGTLRQPRAGCGCTGSSCRLPEVAPVGSDPGFAWATCQGSGSLLRNSDRSLRVRPPGIEPP